jgi:uncharacterized membrane protein
LTAALEWLLWWFVVPVAAAVMLFYGVQDFVPDWTAKLGGGTVGTFTAEHEECGRRSCQWLGSFSSADGTVAREDVGLASGAADVSLGQSVPAVDTGNRVVVYPVGGGWDWLIVTVLDIAVLVLAVVWVLALRRKLRRRREPSRRSRRRPRRNDRFVIGPERRIGGRYVLTRFPGGQTETARSWEDVALACGEHKVPQVVIDPAVQDRLFDEWGPAPDYVSLRHDE